jgi:hypothetical protein
MTRMPKLVSHVARELGITPRRVRALAEAGQSPRQGTCGCSPTSTK